MLGRGEMYVLFKNGVLLYDMITNVELFHIQIPQKTLSTVAAKWQHFMYICFAFITYSPSI